MTRKPFFAGAWMLMLFFSSSSEAANSDTPKCAVVPPPVPSDLPKFEEDARYDLRIGEQNQEQTLYITGDILRVTNGDYASITGSMGRTRSKIASVVLDGRVVELQAPLSFYGGVLKIRADELVIGPGAAINLLYHPSSPNRRLDVVARSIVLSADGPTRPFYVDLASPGAALSIAIASMKAAEGEVPKTSTVTDLWHLTADSLELDSLPPNVTLVTGTDAEGLFRSSFVEEMTWPLHTAAKVRKFFERDPYGDRSADDLTGIYALYRDLFSKYPNPRPLLALEHALCANIG